MKKAPGHDRGPFVMQPPKRDYFTEIASLAFFTSASGVL